MGEGEVGGGQRGQRQVTVVCRKEEAEEEERERGCV